MMSLALHLFQRDIGDCAIKRLDFVRSTLGNLKCPAPYNSCCLCAKLELLQNVWASGCFDAQMTIKWEASGCLPRTLTI